MHKRELNTWIYIMIMLACLFVWWPVALFWMLCILFNMRINAIQYAQFEADYRKNILKNEK